MTDIIIKKDGDGYLAEVIGNDQLFAYGATEQNAKKELLGVVEMMVQEDYIEKKKDEIIKNNLQNNIKFHKLNNSLEEKLGKL